MPFNRPNCQRAMNTSISSTSPSKGSPLVGVLIVSTVLVGLPLGVGCLTAIIEDEPSDRRSPKMKEPITFSSVVVGQEGIPALPNTNTWVGSTNSPTKK